MKEYQLKKRELLKEWLAQCCGEKIQLFHANGLVEEWSFSDELKDFLASQLDEEYIYIMVGKIAVLDVVPLYIGKTTDLLSRWKSHLAKFFKGSGSYSDWHTLLIENKSFNYDVYLYVVPQSNIVIPPIPNFPTSVGSVEYQLIGLALDAYKGYLLNKEGNRR